MAGSFYSLIFFRFDVRFTGKSIVENANPFENIENFQLSHKIIYVMVKYEKNNKNT